MGAKAEGEKVGVEVSVAGVQTPSAPSGASANAKSKVRRRNLEDLARAATSGRLRRPEGAYSMGLSDDYAEQIGQLATLWPHVEEAMIDVFRHLLGDVEPGMARLMFRSIVNQEVRLKVMDSLLCESVANAEKDEWFDVTLKEFRALNGIRNTLLHGLWATHEDGRVYLDTTGGEDWLASTTRHVPLGEFRTIIERMDALKSRISRWRIETELAADGVQPPWLRKPPGPHDAGA